MLHRGEPILDDGINTDILSIKLSQEAENWDDMINKVEKYLQEQRSVKLALKESRINQKKAEEEAEIQKKQSLHKQRTGKKLHVEEEEDEEAQYKKDALQAEFTGANEELDDKFKRDITLMFSRSLKHGVVVFSSEELELIACACKQSLGQVKTSIQKTKDLVTLDKFPDQEDYLNVYLNGLKHDLSHRGNRLIKMLEDNCVQVVASPKARIFFTKLQADIARYMCEYALAVNFHKHKAEAMSYYKQAAFMYKLDRENKIQAGSDIKITADGLSLQLNFGIFMYKNANQKKFGLRKLKRVISEALDDFDKWDDDEIENIKKQIQLIQENINKWSETTDTDSEEEN